ncbi:MAG: HAD family hydrolase [Actinomycetia bacterium]|nr:HAD family hydrolase [Actinomycetes bacterium]MCP4226347.1 HAD family hydrolase [Actinomycetes bacterium]MCP5033232.1 HAD family hydrolase [Actinomycetes bacterium]
MTATLGLELAVVDLAGTTVSDPGVVEAAVRKVTGASFNQVVFKAHRGGSKLEMLQSLIGPEHAQEALTEFEGHILDAIESGAVEALPHADEALARITSAQMRVCLTTGFPTSIREALLKTLGWEQVVDLALSPGPGCRGRPWPDLVLTAALGLEATEMAAVAVVGDTANDIIAARRAGAGIAAAVLTGANDRPALEAANPSHILDHIGHFADLVTGVTTA